MPHATTQPVERSAPAPFRESSTEHTTIDTSLPPMLATLPVAGLSTSVSTTPIVAGPIMVGAAGDAEERQADATAEVVVGAVRRRRLDQPVGRSALLGSDPPIARGETSTAGGGVVGAAGGALPEPLAAVLRRQGGGTPLDGSVRREIEPVLGVSLGAVRTHVGPEATQLNRSMGASAFTLGQDIYFRDGLPDGSSDHGLHLLAHELAHTVQQGPAGAAHRSIRRTLFDPYNHNTTLSAQKATGLPMDKLQYSGMTYAEGGTTGNSVWMEHMVSNTGGGSAPGEPKGIEKIRLIDQRLVWGNGQSQVATAMHAINGDFTVGANNDARNIFMGTAASNTDLHFHRVEAPIRMSLQNNPAGRAVAYEAALAAHPPIAHPTMPGVVVWCNPLSAFPGAIPVAPTDLKYNHASLPGPVSHYLVAGPPTVFTNNARPRFMQYTVVPNYTYSAHPGLPPFLVRNIDQSEVLIKDAVAELAAGSTAITQQQIDNQVAATNQLKAYGHLLFPETFTCTADYFVASYLPGTPWYTGRDHATYDAELVRPPKIPPLKKPKAVAAALSIKKVIKKPPPKKKSTKKKKATWP